MRHRRRRGKLARPAAHRVALLRNLVTSLLDHELIETTDPRAKELKRVADQMITLGKRGDLHARRQAAAFIRERDVVTKLFDDLAKRYAKRPGGYTRIMKLGSRRGDAAEMAILELVERTAEAAETKTDAAPAKGSKKAAPKAEAAAPEEKPKRTRKAAPKADEAAGEEKPKRTRKKKEE